MFYKESLTAGSYSFSNLENVLIPFRMILTSSTFKLEAKKVERVLDLTPSVSSSMTMPKQFIMNFLIKKKKKGSKSLIDAKMIPVENIDIPDT